jgi:hypothetical protein
MDIMEEKIVVDGVEWTIVHMVDDDAAGAVEQATAAPGERRATRRRRRPRFSSWRIIR